MRQPDVVFHLAAAAAPTRRARWRWAGRSRRRWRCSTRSASHAIPKVVVALPATALYGHPATRDLPLKEQPLEPRGLRGVIARAMVDLLATHREVDAIEFTVLALATVYGPRQRADGGVVAAMVEAAATGRPPTITGDGRQTRDLVFVDDAVDALVRAGTRGSGLVVNIGTGEQTSVRELWNLVSGGGGAEPVKAPARPDELPRFALSPVRARIHLGWSPWTSVADGLRQTAVTVDALSATAARHASASDRAASGVVITVGVTTQRMPAASTSAASSASTVSTTSVAAIGAYSLATPATLGSTPSSAIIRSAGPLRAWPPTIGDTATTDSRRAASSASTPGRARIGPIDTSGFDGAITTTSDRSIAGTRRRIQFAAVLLEADRLDRNAVLQAHEVVLERHHVAAAGQADHRSEAPLGHRQRA